jgi:hypothetical protein
MRHPIYVRPIPASEHEHLTAGLRSADALDADTAERLRALLQRSPRAFGKPTSLWTLELAAEVAHAQGLTAHRVSGETIRATHWLTSPDPAYRRKKGGAIA